jgi:hypothetical protein
MKSGRIETLVGWLFTGAVLIGVGLFFLIRGWYSPQLGMAPFQYRGSALDPHLALVGSALFLTIGVVTVVSAVIAKLRIR